jgi:hypothetical protein
VLKGYELERYELVLKGCELEGRGRKRTTCSSEEQVAVLKKG